MSRTRRRLIFFGLLLVLGGGLVAGGIVLISASSSLTLTTSVPVTINASDQFAAVGADNSPSLASDPVSPDHLAVAVRVDRPDFTCAVYASADRGKTWRKGQLTMPTGSTGCYTPALAFSGNGDLDVAFLGLATGGDTTTGTYLARSTDGGLSFAPPVQVAGPDTLQPRLAVDGRRVWVSWLDAGPVTQRPLLGLALKRDNPLMLASSTDGGATFAAPVRINPPSRPHVTGAALAVLGGNLLISYMDLRADRGDYDGTSTSPYPGTVQLVVAGSADGGRTVQEISVAVPALRLVNVMPVYLPPTPALAADASRQQLYLAYQDGSTPGGAILVQRSADGGHSWQAAVRVDSGAGTERRLPALGVAPSGRVDCVYYVLDSSVRPAVGTVGLVTSTDGGAHFDVERDLLTQSFTPAAAPTEPRSQQPDLGDRLGVASGAQWAVLSWADSHRAGDLTRQVVASMAVDIRPKGLSLTVAIGAPRGRHQDTASSVQPS